MCADCGGRLRADHEKPPQQLMRSFCEESCSACIVSFWNQCAQHRVSGFLRRILTAIAEFLLVFCPLQEFENRCGNLLPPKTFLCKESVRSAVSCKFGARARRFIMFWNVVASLTNLGRLLVGVVVVLVISQDQIGIAITSRFLNLCKRGLAIECGQPSFPCLSKVWCRGSSG